MNLKRHYRIEIGAGTALDATGKIIPGQVREQAIREIKRVACELFSGATIIPTTGVWRSPAGQVFDEPGITVTCLIKVGGLMKHKKVLKSVALLADVVKGTLGQAAVAVSVTETLTDFV